MALADASPGMQGDTPVTVTGLSCGEVRGGNAPVYTAVELPGVRGTLYSRPCHGPQGGDVHYLSVCNSGLLTRVCLADVAGHGERVAAVGREMHSLLRHGVNKFDHRKVMALLDRRLESEHVGSITTAALLTYYPPSQRLTVSYAGHPPGWLYRAEAGAWSRLEGGLSVPGRGPTDLPLGTGLAPGFTRRRVKVRTGDRVLVVTDGVLEAPGPDDTEFGIAGVEAALAGDLETLAPRLLDALAAHTGQAECEHDDVTFFVGEFVPGPPGPALWNVLKNRILRLKAQG